VGARSWLRVQAEGRHADTWYYPQVVATDVGTPIIIIAHRDELLGNKPETNITGWPTAIIGKVGGGVHECWTDPTVAGIDTARYRAWLKNFFVLDLVIVDEAHTQLLLATSPVLDTLQMPSSSA